MRRPKCCLHIYTGCFFCFVWKACNQMSFCAWFITFLCHNMIDIPTLLIILIFIDLLCRVKTVESKQSWDKGRSNGWMELLYFPKASWFGMKCYASCTHPLFAQQERQKLQQAYYTEAGCAQSSLAQTHDQSVWEMPKHSVVQLFVLYMLTCAIGTPSKPSSTVI